MFACEAACSSAIPWAVEPEAPSAFAMPLGSMIMITAPSPKMVLPENMSMCRSLVDIGLTTISSVWNTPSTTMPKVWLPTCVVVDLQKLLQVHQRQQLVAQPQDRGVLDALDAVFGVGPRTHQFDHRQLRDRKAVAGGFHDQGGDDGQGQRDLDGDAGALAGHRLDVDGAADLVDIGAHHVHADAAAGHRGDGGSGREARREDELVDLGFRHLLQFGLADETVLDGLGLDPLGVEPSAIVGDADDDVAALVIGGEANGALLGFTGR